MASAFSPSGFGSRWLNSENSTSLGELDSLSWPLLAATDRIDMIKIDKQRIASRMELLLCEKRCRGACLKRLFKNSVLENKHRYNRGRRTATCLNARASASGIASVFQRPAFRLDLG